MDDYQNRLKRAARLNFIAAAAVTLVFFLFTSGLVVPLHEGGWIEAYLSIPVALLCLLVNLVSGGVVLIFRRRAGEKGRAFLRYGAAVVAIGSLLGQLLVFWKLYCY
jgi:cytochrome bd-type quinol oxidase subunit 2